MISAGMAEELIYNAVLLVGISFVLSETPLSKQISIIATAIIFGLAHSAQGIAGVISTGLVGLTFGYGFYLSGRNIYALILGHCLMNTTPCLCFILAGTIQGFSLNRSGITMRIL